MTEPLVSILLPVGKDQTYLKEAVKSVKNQTYINIELLMKKDIGEGTTKTLINLASQAKGEFLARMDADDISAPERIQRQVDYLIRHPKTMLIGSWAILVDKKGDDIGLQKMPTSWDQIKKVVFNYNPLVHSSWMMRREWYKKVGGYDVGYRYSQDWELLLRNVWKYRIENIPEYLMKMRVHEKSSSFANNRLQVWCGIRARIAALARGDIPFWQILQLLPSIVGLAIPVSWKYLWRKNQ